MTLGESSPRVNRIERNIQATRPRAKRTSVTRHTNKAPHSRGRQASPHGRRHQRHAAQSHPPPQVMGTSHGRDQSSTNLMNHVASTGSQHGHTRSSGTPTEGESSRSRRVSTGNQGKTAENRGTSHQHQPHACEMTESIGLRDYFAEGQAWGAVCDTWGLRSLDFAEPLTSSIPTSSNQRIRRFSRGISLIHRIKIELRSVGARNRVRATAVARNMLVVCFAGCRAESNAQARYLHRCTNGCNYYQ